MLARGTTRRLVNLRRAKRTGRPCNTTMETFSERRTDVVLYRPSTGRHSRRGKWQYIDGRIICCIMCFLVAATCGHVLPGDVIPSRERIGLVIIRERSRKHRLVGRDANKDVTRAARKRAKKSFASRRLAALPGSETILQRLSLLTQGTRGVPDEAVLISNTRLAHTRLGSRGPFEEKTESGNRPRIRRRPASETCGSHQSSAKSGDCAARGA